MVPVARLFVAGALLLAGRSTAASDLEPALQLEAQARFEEALAAFSAALTTPGNTREELATIYLHLGLLDFAADDREGSLDALVRLLAVDPDASLPGSAPPEMQALMDTAIERWRGRRLGAEIEPRVQGESESSAVIVVRVVDDVARMVAGAALSSSGEVIAESRGAGPFELEVPPTAFEGSARLTLDLLDEHGGVLWSDESVEITQPRGSEPARSEPQVPARDRRRGVWLGGWALLALGVVSIAAGGALMGVDGTPTGVMRTNDGVIEDEVLNTIAGGSVVLALGITGVVGAVVMLVLSRRRPPAEQESR
jgi:hypothetical protein